MVPMGRADEMQRPAAMLAGWSVARTEDAWPKDQLGTVYPQRHFNTMPRYHFHVVDGGEIFDSQGAVLPDNEAARRRAVELATNLGKTKLADAPTKAVRVTNDKGAILFRVPIRLFIPNTN
jgi:hypothetical protein